MDAVSIHVEQNISPVGCLCINQFQMYPMEYPACYSLENRRAPTGIKIPRVLLSPHAQGPDETPAPC